MSSGRSPSQHQEEGRLTASSRLISERSLVQRNCIRPWVFQVKWASRSEIGVYADQLALNIKRDSNSRHRPSYSRQRISPTAHARIRRHPPMHSRRSIAGSRRARICSPMGVLVYRQPNLLYVLTIIISRISLCELPKFRSYRRFCPLLRYPRNHIQRSATSSIKTHRLEILKHPRRRRLVPRIHIQDRSGHLRARSRGRRAARAGHGRFPGGASDWGREGSGGEDG